MTDLFFSVSAKPGSFGKTLYNTLFAKYGYDGLYVPAGIRNGEDFMKFLHKTMPIAKGMSVSMPFKNLASEIGRPMGFEVTVPKSANTLLFKNGDIYSYNTDAYGFSESCRELLDNTKTCLIYGAGSVSNTIKTTLRQRNIYHIIRTRRDSSFTSGGLLINATPVGMDGIEDNVFTEEVVSKYSCVFDVVAKKETNLIRLAKKLKKPYINGVEMYKFQFMKQFEIYTGIKPDQNDVEEILKENGYV